MSGTASFMVQSCKGHCKVLDFSWQLTPQCGLSETYLRFVSCFSLTLKRNFLQIYGVSQKIFEKCSHAKLRSKSVTGEGYAVWLLFSKFTLRRQFPNTFLQVLSAFFAICFA